MINVLKLVSQTILGGCEIISGKHMGNLEVYCRKYANPD